MNWRILNDGVTAEIGLMDFIGVDGYRADDLMMALNQAETAGAKLYLVVINSLGGDVFDAIAMYNMLVARNATVRIEGIAASAASLIAMSGKRILMYDNAMMMIHNPQWGAWGDESYLKRIQDNLKMIKDSLMKAYARTGLSEEELGKLMDVETWLNAQQAVEKKFADEIIVSGQAPQNVLNARMQYFNGIFSDNHRKVKSMVKIQSALGLPGASEDELVQSINAIKTARNSLDEQMKKINEEVTKLKSESSDKDKKISELEAKLKVEEDAKKKAVEEAAEKELVEVLNQAVKDGKLAPADIDVTNDAGKKGREKWLAVLRIDKNHFATASVKTPVGTPPAGTPPANNKVWGKDDLAGAIKRRQEKVAGAQ